MRAVRKWQLAMMVLCVSAAMPALAKMQQRPVEWQVDGASYSGVLVYDDAGDAKRPGGVVQECGVGLVRVQRDGARLAFAAPPLRRSGASVRPGLAGPSNTTLAVATESGYAPTLTSALSA